jgi:hypothetical protein
MVTVGAVQGLAAVVSAVVASPQAEGLHELRSTIKNRLDSERKRAVVSEALCEAGRMAHRLAALQPVTTEHALPHRWCLSWLL